MRRFWFKLEVLVKQALIAPILYLGPFSPIANFNESKCEQSEGERKCYFVDSQASNNWIALRVRNASHNFVFAESFGETVFKTGEFKCVSGDHCQTELYDYGM